MRKNSLPAGTFNPGFNKLFLLTILVAGSVGIWINLAGLPPWLSLILGALIGLTGWKISTLMKGHHNRV